MYYLQSRYYDPTICRFINADSTDYLGATGTLLSYNLFAYCENDGVNFVDETGCASRAFRYTTSSNTIIKNCSILFESSGNKKLFKNSYSKLHNKWKYSFQSSTYDSSGYHKGNCFLYYRNNIHIPSANIKAKRVVGKIICLTVKEWKAYIVALHYTWLCKMRDSIERLIGPDNLGMLLDWAELCAEAAGLDFVQLTAYVLNSALEVFGYYEDNFNTKFDKYILNSISGRGNNDMVAIVMYAVYQDYRYNGRTYAWKRTKLIKAY